MKNWNHAEKDSARNIVCSEGRRYKTVLLMPSFSCLDLRLLVKNKSITKNDYVFAIECNHSHADKIEKTFVELGLKGRVIRKKCHLINLEQELEGRKLDFIYLDTCTQLNKNNVRWLHEVSLAADRIFSKDCAFWLGFSNYTRTGNQFGDAVIDFYYNESAPLPVAIGMKEEIGNEHQTEKQCVQNKAMFSLLCALFGDGMNYIYKNDKSKQTMHVFCFDEIKPNAKRQKEVFEFLMNYEINAGYKSGNNAAVKAWETRRENAKKEKAHLAAVKAWVTRRANLAS